MALVIFNNTEYSAKEAKINENKLELILNDNKSLSLDIEDNKVISVELHGNIKKCDIFGCAMVYGSIGNGIVENTLIIDGYLNEFLDEPNITRVNYQDIDSIKFKNNLNKNVANIEILGTLDNFETKVNTVTNIHGTIEYIRCKRSLKVCGNINKINVGKQVIGTISLNESPLEEKMRKEEEEKIKNRNLKIIERVQEEFS